jgi:DNA-binding transcriptional LysR family regulator
MMGYIKESDMDSNLLKVFISVANTNSISLAARELKFAQSNVTARIKQLEKNIGHTLFHRIPKGVILTTAGEKLFTYANEIVKKTEEAILVMKNLEKQSSLRVGSTESNAVVRIVPFLLNLHNDHPNMQLELLTGTTAEVTKMILDYKVDIAFISGNPKHSELMVLNQFEEDIVIVEPKSKNVPDVLLLFKKGCMYDSFVKDYYHKQGQNEHKTLEFGSYETILGCVKAGMGKSLLPLSIVQKLDYEDDLNIIELDKKTANIPTTMVCRVDNIPKINEYLEQMKL